MRDKWVGRGASRSGHPCITTHLPGGQNAHGIGRKLWTREMSCLAGGLQLVSVSRTRIQSLSFRLRQCLVPTAHRGLPHLASSLSTLLSGAYVCKAHLHFVERDVWAKQALRFVFPIAKEFLCVTLLRKLPKDDIVSTRMKHWGHQREALEMATGKSRDAFSMLSPHLSISIQKYF